MTNSDKIGRNTQSFDIDKNSLLPAIFIANNAE